MVVLESRCSDVSQRLLALTPISPFEQSQLCAPLQRNVALVDVSETELRGIDERQGALKKVLYGKFGGSINLEDK